VANRWTPAEITCLRNLAAKYSAPEIAEKLDRSVGGVLFKAQQINLSLLSRTTQRSLTAGETATSEVVRRLGTDFPTQRQMD
jgi:hypothetical protein